MCMLLPNLMILRDTGTAHLKLYGPAGLGT